MKRILLFLVTAVLVAVFPLLSARASAVSETPARTVSVDYVLALMDAGIDQTEIVRRIVEKNLEFRLEPGDLDRLREAGCGSALIEVVTAEQDSSQWEHPRRLDIEDGEANDSYGPGYSSFTFSYGYPYYYYPYYPYYYYPSYGYRAFYSSPYYYYPRHSFRSAPRGGGWGRVAPRGGGTGIAPNGGGRPRSAPRGSHR